jgi:hypothetical protein
MAIDCARFPCTSRSLRTIKSEVAKDLLISKLEKHLEASREAERALLARMRKG